MITSLTTKQEEALSRWPEVWRCAAFSCDCVDLYRDKLAVQLIYEAAGIRPPETYLIAESPVSCIIMATVQKKSWTEGEGLQAEVSGLRRRAEAFLRRQIDGGLCQKIARRTFSQTDGLVLQAIVRAVTDQVLEVVRDHPMDALIDRAWDVMDTQLWPDVKSRLNDQERHKIHEEVRRGVSGHLKSQLYGSHDAEHIAFYAYLLEVLGIESAWFMKGLVRLAKYCGWWAPYPKMVILQHRHCELHRDAGGRLHRDGGPAILYRDGFAVWALNGVRVPQWLAESRDTELDPRQVLTIGNAEVRREFVRKVGIDRLCYSLNAKCIDKQGTYELLVLQLDDSRNQVYLKMLNPSIGTWHVEGVHPSCRTIAEALHWRNGVSETPAILS